MKKPIRHISLRFSRHGVLRKLPLVLCLVGAGGCRARSAPAVAETSAMPPTRVTVPASAADPTVVFAWHDYLGHDWNHEAVRVALSAASLKHVAAHHALLDSAGHPVAWQRVTLPAGTQAAIEFLVDVPANGSVAYRFSKKRLPQAAQPSDLKLTDDGATLRLINADIGIALRKKLEPGQGPIQGIRLKSGKWAGDSHLDAKLAPTAYSATVLQQGPVFCEVRCRAEFGDGSSWSQTYRLDAGEPVVTVDETMAMGDKASLFSLSLNEGLAPTQLFYRGGMDGPEGRIGQNLSSPLKPGIAFVLEPWVRWWMRYSQGPVFSAYSDDSPDMLSIGAGSAALWVDPKIPAAQRAPAFVNAMDDGDGLHLDFPLRNGRRQWMIETPDKDASLAVLKTPATAYITPLPHQYVIKHGQFPLQLVKDYVLDWSDKGDSHPHLLMTKAQVDSYRTAHAGTVLEPGELSRLTPAGGLSEGSMDDPMTAWLATANPALGKYLVAQAQATLQQTVDTFLVQPDMPFGAAPHHNHIVGTAPVLADAVLDSGLLTSDQRRKLLAQLAFCGYTINRPDYWSVERGFAANPNMTTSVMGYSVAMGSAIPSHPLAHAWVDYGLSGLKSQLSGWSDSNGGWLEAPHYAMVSYDAILGAALMAHNAGLSEMVYDPQMKKVISWFSKWSTPKDSRFQGFRHLPPVGNTYISEPTGEFGIVAHIWKDKDPEFAANMQWMFRQQHSWQFPGIGGAYATMAGYRKLLVDADIPEKQPQYQTELFPKTGVMLRNGFTSDRETTMLLLANGFDGWRSHWDDDSGSFTLWGKGRIMADDFGYYGMAPAADHNMVDAAAIRAHMLFELGTYAPDPDLDYVSGSKGPWTRQVAFIKNTDPLAPNYFVLCDSLGETDPATWRLWMTAARVTPHGNSALMEGKEDVDMDIFFAAPTALGLATEEKTRTAGSGMRPDGSNGATATTQIGLSFAAGAHSANTYVLYPRLKTEAPPVFTALAGGKGVSIKTAMGTDYVFLGAAPFTFNDGDIAFSGKAGAVRVRGNKVTLILGEGGSIAARGQTLTAAGAARREFDAQ